MLVLREWRLSPRRLQSLLAIFSASIYICGLSAQDLNLSPTRPTIANSATIPDKGVFQFEAGYDAYPGNEQTIGTLSSYVPLKRLRLDFGWSAFNREESGPEIVNGVGTIQIGGKFVIADEQYHHAAPGVAIQYEAELPTASTAALQELGQQVTLLLNHHYGRDGIFDLIVNGSLVQTDCRNARGCTYGGQQSVALSYHIQRHTRLYAEVFGQNNSQSNTLPGTYFFGGFYRSLGDSLGIDGGLRFGLTKDAPAIGATVGFLVGHRVANRH